MKIEVNVLPFFNKEKVLYKFLTFIYYFIRLFLKKRNLDIIENEKIILITLLKSNIKAQILKLSSIYSFIDKIKKLILSFYKLCLLLTFLKLKSISLKKFFLLIKKEILNSILESFRFSKSITKNIIFPLNSLKIIFLKFYKSKKKNPKNKIRSFEKFKVDNLESTYKYQCKEYLLNGISILNILRIWIIFLQNYKISCFNLKKSTNTGKKIENTLFDIFLNYNSKLNKVVRIINYISYFFYSQTYSLLLNLISKKFKILNFFFSFENLSIFFARLVFFKNKIIYENKIKTYFVVFNENHQKLILKKFKPKKAIQKTFYTRKTQIFVRSFSLNYSFRPFVFV
ncbi:hypothetical protein (nucleomorph) [Guillardia theta]|uniref:Uncharacterized protein n=1 Tax=Guillardia theta TaxID=55529 RepID=Q98S62_GUITH|nr:hypothetical protein GTHECHR3076 [Guillardia theta]AAK39720.1 hypothetical protein [Guillardia theta]